MAKVDASVKDVSKNLIVKNIFLRKQKNDNKIKDEQSEEEKS